MKKKNKRDFEDWVLVGKIVRSYFDRLGIPADKLETITKEELNTAIIEAMCKDKKINRAIAYEIDYLSKDSDMYRLLLEGRKRKSFFKGFKSGDKIEQQDFQSTVLDMYLGTKGKDVDFPDFSPLSYPFDDTKQPEEIWRMFGFPIEGKLEVINDQNKFKNMTVRVFSKTGEWHFLKNRLDICPADPKVTCDSKDELLVLADTNGKKIIETEIYKPLDKNIRSDKYGFTKTFVNNGIYFMSITDKEGKNELARYEYTGLVEPSTLAHRISNPRELITSVYSSYFLSGFVAIYVKDEEEKRNLLMFLFFLLLRKTFFGFIENAKVIFTLTTSKHLTFSGRKKR